ncbi:MAG TPA: DUF2092 domain-containing protein [Verrucomicrobiae bacterium]|nr:DUF2092 domain-containing protein [Verrucomicrobiae bacterium]
MARKFIGAAVILGLIIVGVIGYRVVTKVEPQVTLDTALKKTAESKSFRYSMTQQMTVDGNNKLWTQITGEKNQSNTHIKGIMYGSEVDIYQIGDTLYQKDQLSKKWMIVKGTPTAAQDVFMTELNPLSGFNFKETGEVKYLGSDKVNGQKAQVFQMNPSVQNQLMETLWTDFSYKLYVSTKTNHLVKGVLQAKSKVKPDSILTMTVDFKDFGQGIEIKAPTK